MKKLLALVSKLWYVRAERRLTKQIEKLTNGHIAGESARTLARSWLTRRLNKLKGEN